MLFGFLLHANSCPKYYSMPFQNGLSIIVPIYNHNITKPDLDCDGLIDSIDPDIDGDGVDNIHDAFPYNSLETSDIDNDGIGDNTDTYDNRLDKHKLLVYENADSNYHLSGDWTSTLGAPKRVYSSSRGSGVVKIEDGILYKLKINNSSNNVIQWDIRTKKHYSIYVKLRVKTKLNNKLIITNRIIHYYPNNISTGLTKKGYIHIGTGSIDHNLDKWITIRRDLIKDLHEFDPDSRLLSIEEFWIRGESYLDNIEMLSYRIYEDGTTSQNWHIYGDTQNAECISVYDKYRHGAVIKLKGEGLKTGYVLKAFYNTSINRIIQWSMKYNEDFTVYIKVNTRDGIRYLSYNNKDYNERSKNNQRYLYFGIGKSIVKSGWHTITRDLNEDLKEFEKNNRIINIVSFSIRGSGFIDDISLLKSKKVEDDPVYSHKHYAIDVSALTTEVDLTTFDLYVNRLSERHHPEEGSTDAIILNYKKMHDKKWNNKILIRGNKESTLQSPNISKHPYSSDKFILRYNKRSKYGVSVYIESKLVIIDLKNHILNKTLNLKKIPNDIALYGNTLFTPSGKILLSGYGNKCVKIFRSLEAFDDDRLDYEMEEIASFKKEGEIFLEPVLSYVFDKLVVAIRKDILWFNDRDGQQELYNNTKGELRFITDLEGGDIKTIWHKKVLDVEIHGPYMPGYQYNHFLMLASDGGNRQKIVTLNSSDNSLNSFVYNKDAFTLNNPRGGGYPSYLKNEDETLVFYWEETNDLRRTNIIEKKLR